MSPRALAPLLCLACATAPPALTPLGDLGVADLHFRPQSATLSDGLRVVHEEVPGSGAVALVLTIRAGSARDPETRRGLAHLVEHLTFRARDDAGQTLWDRYERLGATRLNAFTDHESTVYVAVVPRVSFAAAIALEAGRLRAPLHGISDDELATEREVVRNEILERNERNLEGGLLAWAADALYPAQHRYRHPVGGTTDSVASIVAANARFFTLTHYRPRNATLTVVGDVTRAEVLRALAGADRSTALSGPDPLPDLVDVPLAPPDPPAGDIAHVQGSYRGPRIWIAWTLPGTYSPAAGASELVPRLLSATVDESVLQLLGEPGRDVAQVRFFLAPGLLASTLFAEAHLREGHYPERSAAAIIDQVAGLARPVGDDARGLVAHAMMSSLTSTLLQTEDLLVRATRYAEADRVTGDARNAVDRLRRGATIDADTLRNYVAAYLTSARARVAVVTPRRAETRPLPTGLEPQRAPAEANTLEPAPPPIPLASPAGARRWRLPNGLEVVLWPRPGFPAVAAALMFRGGRAAANPPGAESFLDELLPLRYCGGLPSFRGISLGTDVLPDAVVETAAGGAQNVSAILLSLAERAAAYRFDRWPVLARLRERTCLDLSPAEEIPRLWREVRASGVRRLDQRRLSAERSSARAANSAVGRALLGGTPYEPPAADEVAKITEEQLASWYASSRRPDNAVLVLVGQLDPDAVAPLVRDWFSSWKAAGPPPVARPAAPPPAPRPRLFRVTEAGVDQGELTLSCLVPSASPPERAAGQVLAHLLARELRLRLRDQLGATYGVAGDLLELKTGTAMLHLATDVARAHLGAALGEAIGQLDALVAGPPAAAPLRRAQLDVFRALAGPATSDRLLAQATHVLMLGESLESLDRAPEAAAQVTGASLRAAAAACRRSLTIAAVGDAAALAPIAPAGFVVEDLR